jgi:hypothetical protein
MRNAPSTDRRLKLCRDLLLTVSSARRHRCMNFARLKSSVLKQFTDWWRKRAAEVRFCFQLLALAVVERLGGERCRHALRTPWTPIPAPWRMAIVTMPSSKLARGRRRADELRTSRGGRPGSPRRMALRIIGCRGTDCAICIRVTECEQQERITSPQPSGGHAAAVVVIARCSQAAR